MTKNKELIAYCIITLMFSLGTIFIYNVSVGSEKITQQVIRFSLNSLLVFFALKEKKWAYWILGSLLLIGGLIGGISGLTTTLPKHFFSYFYLIMSGFYLAAGFFFLSQARKKKIKDLTLEEIVELSKKSYLLYGHSFITGGLLFHGFQKENNNINLIASMADFFTESNPDAASVIYYYLFERKDDFKEDDYRKFMVMFTDAMYQYGLAKHNFKTEEITIGDLSDYSSFQIDFEKLTDHVIHAIAGFSTIENFILVLESSLGIICSFLEKKDTQNMLDLLPAEMIKTDDYYKWIETSPKEIKKLQRIIS